MVTSHCNCILIMIKIINKFYFSSILIFLIKHNASDAFSILLIINLLFSGLRKIQFHWNIPCLLRVDKLHLEIPNIIYSKFNKYNRKEALPGYPSPPDNPAL